MRRAKAWCAGAERVDPASAAPWLSVLVPVHNVAPYLEECIGSLLAQADGGVELVLLDDASSDGSLALAQALAARDPARVRVLHTGTNAGVAVARNRLLDEARGRWLWFVDGDDSVEPGVLPRLHAHALDPQAPELLLLDYRVRRSRPSLKHRLRGEHHRAAFAGRPGAERAGGTALLEGVLASGNVFCWTVVAQRSLWQRGPRFVPGRVFEDMATMPRLLLRAHSAAHLAVPAIAYRRRDDSLSGVMSAAKVADLGAALCGLRDELLQLHPGAGAGTRFAVAHQAARNLVAAVRHARRLPADEAAALLPRCRADFRAAVGPDLPLLWSTYRRRGWWARAFALRRALGDS